jgi:hypothetical protein
MAFVQSPTIQPLSTGAMTFGGIQNNWDAIKEDFDAVAYLPFGDEYWSAMNQIMNGIGNREIATNPRVRWFELTRMEVPMTVATGATFTTGGSNDVILDTDDRQELPAGSGNFYSWCAVHEIWRDAATGNLYQIVAKDPDAITITLQPVNPPVSGGVVSNVTIANNAVLFYVGVSVPENSTAQAGKFMFDDVYTSFLQTMRHDIVTSSESLYNELWYSQLENGTATPYSNSRDIIYLQREHQVAIVNTFLAGSQTTNTALVTNGPAATSFQTTPGLIPTIFDRGQTFDYGGTLDAAAIYALENLLTAQDGSVKNYMVWTTGTTSQAIEESLLAYNANANIQVNKVQMEKTFWGEGAYADLMSTTYSFNTVVFNNKNFNLVRMGIFDNPQTFATTGSTWNDYAVFLPMAPGNVDDGMGNLGKYIRLAHKPGAFMNMWQTGGRAAANKTDAWQLGVHIVSEIAFKFINANKYGLLYTTV